MYHERICLYISTIGTHNTQQEYGLFVFGEVRCLFHMPCHSTQISHTRQAQRAKPMESADASVGEGCRLGLKKEQHCCTSLVQLRNTNRYSTTNLEVSDTEVVYPGTLPTKSLQLKR